jgi:hypothetical protein
MVKVNLDMIIIVVRCENLSRHLVLKNQIKTKGST